MGSTGCIGGSSPCRTIKLVEIIYVYSHHRAHVAITVTVVRCWENSYRLRSLLLQPVVTLVTLLEHLMTTNYSLQLVLLQKLLRQLRTKIYRTIPTIIKLHSRLQLPTRRWRRIRPNKVTISPCQWNLIISIYLLNLINLLIYQYI